MSSLSRDWVEFLYNNKKVYYGLLFTLILSPIIVAIINNFIFYVVFYSILYYPLVLIPAVTLFFIFGFTEGSPHVGIFSRNFKGLKLILSIIPYIGPFLCAVFTVEEFKKIEKDNPDFILKKELVWIDGSTKKYKYQTVDYNKDKQKMWGQSNFDPKKDYDYPLVQNIIIQVIIIISVLIF